MNRRTSAGSPDRGPGFRRFGIPLPDTQEMPVVPEVEPARRRSLALPLVGVSIIGTAIGLMLPTGAPDTAPVPPSSSTTSVVTRSVRLTERPEPVSLPERPTIGVQSESAKRTASQVAIRTTTSTASQVAIRTTTSAAMTSRSRSKSSTPPATPSGKPTKTATLTQSDTTTTTTTNEES